ncbi:MAG: cysteine synthase A [Clostridia bacterium]|nr:cysteine synthase A [Clostridia bacterium]
MEKIYSSALELIGKTPLLRLYNIEKRFNLQAELVAKLELFNPGGSAKDRVALNMLAEAEKKGLIKSDTVIIEPTSGNTGIGLALVAAVKGYRVIIVMPETMSEERKKLISAYGAELVLTEGAKGMSGAIERANELSKEYENSFIPDQFGNPDNPKAHFNTTAYEIYADTAGNIDIFVAGIGTGGTITGVGSFLKEKNSDIKIVGAEPLSSPVLSGGKAGAHKIQGIGAGFVPDTLNTDILDEIITVSDEQAFDTARLIAKTEGVLVGISSGAALFAALELAKREENKNKRIVVLLPDTGERYLSNL